MLFAYSSADRSGARDTAEAITMRWDFPSWTAEHLVYMYQRVSEVDACYSPNHAHEGGVYLQFVVDHMPDNLPAYIIFAQVQTACNSELFGHYCTPLEVSPSRHLSIVGGLVRLCTCTPWQAASMAVKLLASIRGADMGAAWRQLRRLPTKIYEALRQPLVT